MIKSSSLYLLLVVLVMSDSASDIISGGEILEEDSGDAPVSLLANSRRCCSLLHRLSPNTSFILQHLTAQNMIPAPSLDVLQLQELADASYCLHHTPPPSFAPSDLEPPAPVESAELRTATHGCKRTKKSSQLGAPQQKRRAVSTASYPIPSSSNADMAQTLQEVMSTLHNINTRANPGKHQLSFHQHSEPLSSSISSVSFFI